MDLFNKRKVSEVQKNLDILQEENKVLKEKLDFLMRPDTPEEERLVLDNIPGIYKITKSIFTNYEKKLYEIFDKIFKSDEFIEKTQNKYVFFPKVRVGDVIMLFEENFYGKEKIISDKSIFIKGLFEATNFDPMKSPNAYKEAIRNYIISNSFDNKEFSEKVYDKLVKYRLLNKHIDFLVCEKEDWRYAPKIFIELNGEEHLKSKVKQTRDLFKQGLFGIGCKHTGAINFADSYDYRVDFTYLSFENKDLNEDNAEKLVYDRLMVCLQ